MPYQEDLKPFVFRDFSMLISVGWLCQTQPFRKGPVNHDFLTRLTLLLRSPVQDPFTNLVMFGRHYCGLCPLEKQSRWQEIGQQRIDIGRRNLFVPKPDSNLVYIAPSTIIHYILEHGYCPPEEFQEATLQCPKMRSRTYYREMRKRGACVWSWWRFLRGTHLGIEGS